MSEPLEPAEQVLSASTAHSSFVANVATVLGGQAGNIGLALLTEICFARLLGPGPRGQISLCLMAIGFGVLAGGLGGDIPVVIWGSDRNRPPSQWTSTIVIWCLLGSAAAVFLWSAIYWRWHPAALRGVTPSLFRVVLLSIPLAALFSYLNAFLTGREKFRERAGVGFAENTTGLAAFLVLMLLLGRTADSALWGYFAGIAAGIFVAAFLLREELRGVWRKPAVNRDITRGLLTGLRGQIGNVAAFFNYRFDVFLVNYFLDSVQVGLYALGVALSEGLWQIPQATALALFPRTARTSGEDASAFTCLIMRHVFVISCVSAGALALISPLAVPLLFGERFAPSVRVIWWILPGTIAISMGKVAASHLSARHKTGRNSLFGGIALVVTLGLDFLLIPRMGIPGAAIASSASYIVNGALLLTALRKELGANWMALFVPTSTELLRYKSAVASLLAWSRMRIEQL